MKLRGMEMKRGQAFDTMMLVISVIVAVAILGMLLGFLGGIGGFGAKAKDVIPDLVKKVQQSGFGLEPKENVEFSKGDSIYQATAKGTAPISTDAIKFICYDDNVCSGGTDTPLTVEDNKIVCNENIAVAIVVCFNDDDSEYVVGIGQTLTGSRGIRSQAESDCGLS